jgi:hypothetical protein
MDIPHSILQLFLAALAESSRRLWAFGLPRGWIGRFSASVDIILIEKIRVWRLPQNNGRDCPADIRFGQNSSW